MSLTKLIRSARMGARQIITPRLNDFLRANPNLVLDDWVADLIREQLVKKPRDRTRSFSSSAAGMCQRRQMFDYLGLPQNPNSPQVQNIFYDGTWRHLRWQAVLLQAGIIDRIEFPLTWEAQRSVGTMDGLGVVPDDHSVAEWQGMEFGFELKGSNTYGYKSAVANATPPSAYMAQVHRYFLSGGFDLFVVIMEDKNNQEWTEWVITPDEALLDAQRLELEQLNGYVKREELPPMLPGCIDKTATEWSKGYCPFAGDGGVCESHGLEWSGGQ